MNGCRKIGILHTHAYLCTYPVYEQKKNKNKTIVKTDSRDYFQEFFSYDIIFISINLPEFFGRTPSKG